MKLFKFFGLTLFTGLVFTSCSSDDDLPTLVNEEEIITTMKVTLTPNDAGAEQVTWETRDLDGDGPNPPVVTTSGPLLVNTQYNGQISLLNETLSPAENITEEVVEEADEHQFFYIVGGTLETTIVYTDFDENGNELGSEFSLVTGAESAGVLTITLRHLPKKPNSGIADAGGETDFTTSFSVSVEGAN